PYYGSWDSTPLYLVALHNAWRWFGDDMLLKGFAGTAYRCLEWIDQHGDIDGDGFQEFQTRSSKGYENMVWKDSVDGIIYPDGKIVGQPKAVCELQGYVFDAWMCCVEMFDRLGDTATAKELRQKALKLREQFE